MNYKFLDQRQKSYNCKLIASGKVLEYFEYQKPVVKSEFKKISGRANAAFTSIETKEENRSKTASRARKRVQRIINSNPHLDKFLTLTFAENITDIDFAEYEFDKFIKRLKTRQKGFQFVKVVEFQERGAVHFHLLCNLPYVDVNALGKVWNNGFIRLNKIDNIDNVGAYVTKYMTKDSIDERLIGRKCYSMSKGLKQPKEYTNEKDIERIMENIDCVKRIYTAEYETEHYGVVKYTQIICENAPYLPNRLKRLKAYLIPMPDSVLSPFDLSLNGV